MTHSDAPVIAFAGMTHLGICSAAAAAARGLQVIGYDPDASLVQSLNDGEPPIVEPGLTDILTDQTKRLHFTDAINADNRRSTAYSDLGLALAVQGKGEDAALCFARAKDLDFENSVVPRLGAAAIKLALFDSLSEDDTEEQAAPKRPGTRVGHAQLASPGAAR